MPQGPAEPYEEGAERTPPPGTDGEPKAHTSGSSAVLAEPVPRGIKADVLPSAIALVLITLLGLPLGLVWPLLAPTQLAIGGSDGVFSPSPAESYHDFDALGIFLLLGFATGVLTAAALWMVRRSRGPVLLAAGVLGSLAASWLALHLGNWFADMLHPVVPQPRTDYLISLPPRISTPWAITTQPLALALAYGVVASWNGTDDLDRSR